MRISDWSSDVCSSDLLPHRGMAAGARTHPAPGPVDGRPVEAGLRRRCRMNAVATHEHVVAARNLRKAYKTTVALDNADFLRSEEHTSELQSLMRSSYAVFCLKKKIKTE